VSVNAGVLDAVNGSVNTGMVYGAVSFNTKSRPELSTKSALGETKPLVADILTVVMSVDVFVSGYATTPRPACPMVLLNVE
jgi:hypothetical protein